MDERPQRDSILSEYSMMMNWFIIRNMKHTKLILFLRFLKNVAMGLSQKSFLLWRSKCAWKYIEFRML